MSEKESVLEKILKDSSDDFSEFTKKIEKYLSENLTKKEKEGDNYIYFITKIGYKKSNFNNTLNEEALAIGWKNITLDYNNLYVIKIEKFSLPKKEKKK